MCSWFISPLQIYQPSLMSNGWLDSVGKLDSIFFLLPFGNNNKHVLSLMSKPTRSQAQLHDTHLLMHSGHVPHVTHDGPAGHHPQQVADHAILGAVPESISKLWVVLKIKKNTEMLRKNWTRKGESGLMELQDLHGYWVYGGSNFKTSLFKHHDRCVVDAGAWEKTRGSMRTS